jgi:polyhydroxyalkanoate synthase
MLTGRAARRTTWPVLDEWIDHYSSAQPADDGTPPPSGSGGTPPIGTGRRRHGSGASRALAT